MSRIFFHPTAAFSALIFLSAAHAAAVCFCILHNTAVLPFKSTAAAAVDIRTCEKGRGGKNETV